MFLSAWHDPDCQRKTGHAESNSLREGRWLQLRALSRHVHSIQYIYMYICTWLATQIADRHSGHPRDPSQY